MFYGVVLILDKHLVLWAVQVVRFRPWLISKALLGTTSLSSLARCGLVSVSPGISNERRAQWRT